MAEEPSDNSSFVNFNWSFLCRPLPGVLEAHSGVL
jgi:hypothetical protein